MRLYLLAFLALFGMNAMAADNWKAFPYDQSAYDYPGDKLKEAWPRLTRGFGDYPYPDADWVVNMATAHPDALEKTVKAGTGFTGKPEEAAQYAARLQDVWRLLFRGDYAKAKEQGLALGVGGQVPAMFAQVLYAMFLAPDQAEKQRLLEEVIDYTEQAGPLVKADIVAQFGSVYAKARLAEELSVPVVLKRGYTSEIPKELDALLARQPNQPFALALYGGYEAGVIKWPMRRSSSPASSRTPRNAETPRVHEKRGCHRQPLSRFRPGSGPVRTRQVFVGLHFQQTTEGALEFELQPAAAVEIL